MASMMERMGISASVSHLEDREGYMVYRIFMNLMLLIFKDFEREYFSTFDDEGYLKTHLEVCLPIQEFWAL